MQKTLFFFAFLLFASFSASAQNAKRDETGNYTYVAPRPKTLADLEKGAEKTKATYKDKDGTVYPVYLSKTGKPFYIRTSKNGNVYRAYLKVD